MHYEYYLAGEPIGGAIVRVASTAMIPLPAGDTTHFIFTLADFPAGAELSSFQLELFVVMQDDTELAVSPLIELSDSYGGDCQFALTGSNIDGFTVEPLSD